MSNFCPYVLIQTAQNRPSSISAADWTGNQHRYLNLAPESTEDHLAAVQETIRASHQESNGIAFNYGQIIGYRVVFSPNESLVLNTKAEMLSRERGVFWPRSITPRIETVSASEQR